MMEFPDGAAMTSSSRAARRWGPTYRGAPGASQPARFLRGGGAGHSDGRGGATSKDVRREALEESVSTTVQNDHYFQESLGVYSMLFMTGNFPNPMIVPKK